MRSEFKRSSEGYSLAELLTVVAIIGILSLIGVPAFMNYQRASYMKGTLRQFTHDLRAARQYAITQSIWVRVEIETGSNDPTKLHYWYFSSADNGNTWTALNNTISGTTNGNQKQVGATVWFDNATGLNADPDGVAGHYDIDYQPNGAMVIASGSTNATVVLATKWTNIASNRYTITLGPAGSLTSTAWHT